MKSYIVCILACMMFLQSWAVPLAYSDDEAFEDIETDSYGGRYKRQAVNNALDLSLSHQDHLGRDRPVGRIHGRLDAIGSGNDARNYNAHLGAGLGSVVYRSRNDKHSVGVGAYASRLYGSHRGYNYRSRPDVGFGVGYKFRF